jgi:hypothetical protein
MRYYQALLEWLFPLLLDRKIELEFGGQLFFRIQAV